MSSSTCPGGKRRALLRRHLLLSSILVGFCPASLRAQEHDDDHDHVHFSHPLVTESPTPDTKLRFDFITSRTGGGLVERENEARLEGEFAFTNSLSLAIVTPYVWRSTSGTPTVSRLGSIVLSLKAASVWFGERGILVGGGLSAALPTGSDAKRIGSSHAFELEPFVDIGYKRKELELVSVASLSSTLHRRPGEQEERTFTLDASALYPLASRLEVLIEITSARALLGPESGQRQTFIAPGLKVYPFTNRKIMFGASLELGTGVIRDTCAVLISGFYHF